MKIGVVGPTQADTFADNVASALTTMGIESTLLGPAYTCTGSEVVNAVARVARQAQILDDGLQKRLVARALERECDAVITVDARLAVEAVAKLRNNGVRTALWFPDHVTNFSRGSMLLAPYAALFFKEPFLVRMLRNNLGLPVHYLPEACNPVWHRPPGDSLPVPSVVVAGNMYPSRALLLRRLWEVGIPLTLYGSGFPRWLDPGPLASLHTGRHIVREEKAQVFRGAAAVLNNLHPGEIEGVNARLFEATGCGAVVLTEHRMALPDLFSPGHEVLTYTTFDELVAQAHKALDEYDVLRAMGDAASKRAHAEHTYAHRLPTILETLL